MNASDRDQFFVPNRLSFLYQNNNWLPAVCYTVRFLSIRPQSTQYVFTGQYVLWKILINRSRISLSVIDDFIGHTDPLQGCNQTDNKNH